MTPQYPKRLIEADLPIKRISAHARRENPFAMGISPRCISGGRAGPWRAGQCCARHCGPIPPIRCVARVPGSCSGDDDGLAQAVIKQTSVHNLLTDDEFQRWRAFREGRQRPGPRPIQLAHMESLRGLLLDFIGALSPGRRPQATSPRPRALTQVPMKRSVAPGTRPLVVDPFAGGGSIPLKPCGLARMPSPLTSIPWRCS